MTQLISFLCFILLPSEKKKIGKVLVFLSVTSLFLHTCDAFLLIALATAMQHLLSGYNPKFRSLSLTVMPIFLFLLLPERFAIGDGTWNSCSYIVVQMKTWYQEALGKGRRNEEGSDPCCTARTGCTATAQNIDRLVGKSILVLAREIVNSSEFHQQTPWM